LINIIQIVIETKLQQSILVSTKLGVSMEQTAELKGDQGRFYCRQCTPTQYFQDRLARDLHYRTEHQEVFLKDGTKLCRNANNEFTCPECHKIIFKYPWNAKRHIAYCNGQYSHTKIVDIDHEDLEDGKLLQSLNVVICKKMVVLVVMVNLQNVLPFGVSH
jgi:hypothetical protein